jgi:cytochrome b561
MPKLDEFGPIKPSTQQTLRGVPSRATMQKTPSALPARYSDVISQNDAAFDFLKTTHYWLDNALFAIVVLHIPAALKHHFWNKDDVLARMLPFSKSRSRS